MTTGPVAITGLAMITDPVSVATIVRGVITVRAMIAVRGVITTTVRSMGTTMRGTTTVLRAAG